ncbi:hypothetical protein PHYPSEUDO_001422 [Phytophthora pseudosyringae]|uniref:Secreted protein n=1 Tax=Phytophthora pseudosyringae TaxID=221518 RepID=A0A8T1WIG3_9STRA|nr:hypothetical protein PHYPSEUDO_001422 [Phytophthora pseudosyringae]
MKTSWAATFVVVAAALVDPAAGTCKSACQSQLVHFREEACQKWRERLPRPDLFNHCGQGFNKGKTAGCEGFCKEVPEMGVMKSLRLDACSSLKGVPPSERQHACQAGFSAALDLAKDAAVPEADQETAQAAAPSTQGSQATAPEAGTGRRLEDATDSRKVKVKKVIPENEPARRNLLDEARREAEAAFQDGTGEKLEL